MQPSSSTHWSEWTEVGRPEHRANQDADFRCKFQRESPTHFELSMHFFDGLPKIIETAPRCQKYTKHESLFSCPHAQLSSQETQCKDPISSPLVANLVHLQIQTSVIPIPHLRSSSLVSRASASFHQLRACSTYTDLQPHLLDIARSTIANTISCSILHQFQSSLESKFLLT